MPAHEIKLHLPPTSVNYTDVEFEVWSGDTKLGELHVSRGTVQWVPGGAKRYSHHVSWEEFAKWMETKPPQ